VEVWCGGKEDFAVWCEADLQGWWYVAWCSLQAQ
jgi:hypothetical protein